MSNYKQKWDKFLWSSLNNFNKGNIFFGHHFSIPFIVHTVMLLRKSWWEVSTTVYVCYYYSILTLCLRAFHIAVMKNGILFPKLNWPNVRKKNLVIKKGYFVTKIVQTYCEKKCSSDREFFLKFEDEGQEFSKKLRSLEQFVWIVKGQNNI
jgi:hypothetical protein